MYMTYMRRLTSEAQVSFSLKCKTRNARNRFEMSSGESSSPAGVAGDIRNDGDSMSKSSYLVRGSLARDGEPLKGNGVSRVHDEEAVRPLPCILFAFDVFY